MEGKLNCKSHENGASFESWTSGPSAPQWSWWTQSWSVREYLMTKDIDATYHASVYERLLGTLQDKGRDEDRQTKDDTEKLKQAWVHPGLEN